MNTKTFLAAAVALGAATFATSSFAADATSTATGTVIVPIEITSSANLVFGRFAKGTGGTVTVSTNGTRSETGGVVLSTIGSSPTAAEFDVTGDANATYSISITPSATLTSGDNSMELATFSDFAGAGATSGDVTTAGGTLGAGGTQTIYIGGTLTVDAGQVAGDYAGSVAVSVEYN